MASYEIAVIPGDGITLGVMPACLRAAAAVCGFDLNFSHFHWSYERYRRDAKMMPDDGIARLRNHEAIFLGAVGFPGVPDHISLWDLLISIRRELDQYVNLRPVRLLQGFRPPVCHEEIDLWIVREIPRVNIRKSADSSTREAMTNT